MPTTIGSGGNRAIRNVTVGSGGNRTVRSIYVGSGGNRLVFAALNLLGLDPYGVGPAPGPNNATYTLTSGGLEQATGSASSTWMTAGVASDYDVMLTVNSGSISSGAATGAWLNLGTTRSWTVSRGGVVGQSVANTTVQIRATSSGVVLASVNVIITAETT